MYEAILSFGSCSTARSVVFSMVSNGCPVSQGSKTIADSHYGDAVPTRFRQMTHPRAALMGQLGWNLTQPRKGRVKGVEFGSSVG